MDNDLNDFEVWARSRGHYPVLTAIANYRKYMESPNARAETSSKDAELPGGERVCNSKDNNSE